MVGESPLRLNPSGVDAIGVPSAGLSLGGLLASRARLRFTRPGVNSSNENGRQGQRARDQVCSIAVMTTGWGVAKEWPFFVQRSGSTSLLGGARLDQLAAAVGARVGEVGVEGLVDLFGSGNGAVGVRAAVVGLAAGSFGLRWAFAKGARPAAYRPGEFPQAYGSVRYLGLRVPPLAWLGT